MKATPLTRAYPREWNSWRNRKSKCTKFPEKYSWALVWRVFRDFLLSQGPMPQDGKQYTLDRIDNANGHYGPDLCRWATKVEQNNNKGDNIKIVHPTTGVVFNSRKLAKKHRVKLATIHKRSAQGYTDLEMIVGKRDPDLASVNATLPAPKIVTEPVLQPPMDVAWSQAMSAAYPGEAFDLTAAEKGMLKSFAACCSLTPPRDVLDCAVRHWASFVNKAKNDHGAYNTPSKPTPQFLLKYPRAAVNLWLDANNLVIGKYDLIPKPKAPEPSEPVKKLSIPEPVRLTAPPEPKPKPPTLAEIMAVLNEDDE